MRRTTDEETGGAALCPSILALFQKRVDGDDALLHLARLRFLQAGLGTEFYAGTQAELEYLLQFKPHPETPAVVHLPREINVLDEKARAAIADFAVKAKGRVFGLVVHDQPEAESQMNNYAAALREVDSLLNGGRGPCLFVEYASGLDTDVFIDLFQRIRGLSNVSACIDTGHIGIWKTCKTFSQLHPETDVCDLRPEDPGLSKLISDISYSVESALPETVRVVRELGALGKVLHFHLHDGHPLSSPGPYGMSDHMSFLETLPLPFEFRGMMSAPLMYGPTGLSSIVSSAMGMLPPDRISFCLEIHPGRGRLSLADASHYFDHWEDATNAERMNFWLAELSKNKKLVDDACRQFYGARDRG